MLYGIAIIDTKGNSNVIWSFDKRSVLENVIKRFKILFDAKKSGLCCKYHIMFRDKENWI